MWGAPSGPSCIQHTRCYRVQKSDHIDWELTHCSIWMFFTSPRSSLTGVPHKACTKMLLKMSREHIKGWMERRAEREREEEPSMHDQTSVSHWSASLAFLGLLLWLKSEEDEDDGGGYNREFRDIGRQNDQRSCLFTVAGGLKGGVTCCL